MTIDQEVRRWPSMRFCDAPSRNAETRFDLNANGIGYSATLMKDGFALGMPVLSGEPGGRGRVWSGRSLSLPLEVVGAKSDVRRRLERVARELMRAENWLEWQLDADSAPRWFRTYAAAPSPLSLTQVYTRRGVDVWGTTLSAPADPFAVGEPITLGPFTVTNAPDAGTYPMLLDLGDVEGEAPAPATVVISKSTSGPMLGPAVAVTSTPATTFTPDSWGSAVAAAVTDANFIGGSYRPTTGTIDDWTTVAAFTPTDLTYGRWSTLLRVSGSSDAGSIALRWKVSATGVASQVYSTPVVVPVHQQRRWVTAGEVPWPLVDGTALGVTGTTVLTLQAKRIQSGGELRFDNRLTMLSAAPESSLLRLEPDAVSGASSAVLIDAEARRVAAAVGGAPTRAPGVAGGWPHLSPTRENHLWVAQNLDPTFSTGVHDAHTSTSEVTITYRPRYLWGV